MDLITNENAASLLGVGVRPVSGISLIDQLSSTGGLLEIYGAAASGKTTILIHIACCFLLPKDFGGTGTSVIWFNLDGKFPMKRLVAALTSHVKMFSCDSNDEVVKAALEKCLVISCTDEAQLLEGLRSMPQMIANDHNIHAVIIDHIAAFYWISRVQGDGAMENQINIAHAMRVLVKEHRMPVFVAKPALFGGGGYREYLPAAWQSLAPARLLCSRIDNRLFHVVHHTAHSAGSNLGASGMGTWRFVVDDDRLSLQ